MEVRKDVTFDFHFSATTIYNIKRSNIKIMTVMSGMTRLVSSPPRCIFLHGTNI